MDSQKENMSFFRHSVCLTAIFIIGNTVIYLPFKNTDCTNTMPMLIALSAGILLLTAVSAIVFKIKIKSRILRNALLFLLVAGAIAAAIMDCTQYVKFVSRNMLPEISHAVIALIFFALMVFFACAKNTAFYKFALICAVISASLIVILFFVSLPQYNFKIITFNANTDAFKSVPRIVLKIFSSAVTAVVFMRLSLKKPKTLSVSAGALCAGVLIFLVYLCSVLIFGTAASVSDFPFADAVSTVSVGVLFTRMDGLAYILFFFSSLIRCSVSVKAAFAALRRINSISVNRI